MDLPEDLIESVLKVHHSVCMESVFSLIKSGDWIVRKTLKRFYKTNECEWRDRLSYKMETNEWGRMSVDEKMYFYYNK